MSLSAAANAITARREKEEEGILVGDLFRQDRKFLRVANVTDDIIQTARNGCAKMKEDGSVIFIGGRDHPIRLNDVKPTGKRDLRKFRYIPESKKANPTFVEVPVRVWTM